MLSEAQAWREMARLTAKHGTRCIEGCQPLLRDRISHEVRKRMVARVAYHGGPAPLTFEEHNEEWVGARVLAALWLALEAEEESGERATIADLVGGDEE